MGAFFIAYGVVVYLLSRKEPVVRTAGIVVVVGNLRVRGAAPSSRAGRRRGR